MTTSGKSIPLKESRKKKRKILTDRHGRRIPKQPSMDPGMRRFTEYVDRHQLMEFLEASAVSRHETLLMLMLDPSCSGLSFANLAKRAGVTLQELQQVYMDGQRHLALLRMSSALPEVMGDIVEDARSRMESCPRCDALGKLPDGQGGLRDCPTCRGKGEVRRMGDAKMREMVMEGAKVIKQSSGPMIAIQQNFSSDTRMEDMLARTRSIALDKKPITLLDSGNDKTETV